ncbi:MAG: ATP-dependent helicase [Actinomycetota bacterium]
MRDPFEGLNEQQCAAVEAVRGPVCILAGAGTGKTTTITRRIANQVLSDTFAGNQILAVTFTDKAAREMASRVYGLGATGVRVKTFHAEALAQYAKLGRTSPEIIPSKGALLASIAQRLPPPYKFKPVRDLATEIEWAKNRRLRPDRYLDALNGHVPPIPPDLMAGVWRQYERKKGTMIDFEDLLERTLEVLADARAASIVHARYAAVTVDEYQDVNLLQQGLLDVWVGRRDDVCVVGDDHQAIFSFTGADPKYLLSFPDRYPDATVVRLENNYRSTPEILAVANRLAPGLGGPQKMLRTTTAEGPHPELRQFASGTEEVAHIVQEARRIHLDGVPYEQIGVLIRINGRSEDFEEAFSQAGIPFQVRDGAFLRRPAARSVLARLKRETGSVADAVERVALGVGLGQVSDDATDEEATRQADLERLVRLGREFPGDSIDDFVADLRARFAPEEHGRGVVLLTYHAAKGLEFEAVFLPRLEEGELPYHLSAADDEIAEERRLLYVGITRARRYLMLSWAASRSTGRRARPRPSRFLAEIAPGAGAAAGAPPRRSAQSGASDGPSDPVASALRAWRTRVSRDIGKPAYTVFANDTLDRIAALRPETLGELIAISGVGPAKLTKFGEEVLAIVKSAAAV